MVYSGYVVKLVCDRCDRIAEFGGSDSKQFVWRIVRQSGWATNKKQRVCICPQCQKEINKYEQ